MSLVNHVGWLLNGGKDHVRTPIDRNGPGGRAGAHAQGSDGADARAAASRDARVARAGTLRSGVGSILGSRGLRARIARRGKRRYPDRFRALHRLLTGAINLSVKNVCRQAAGDPTRHRLGGRAPGFSARLVLKAAEKLLAEPEPRDLRDDIAAERLRPPFRTAP